MSDSREPKTHELKTWPGYFRAIASGLKTFDARHDDGRDFREGDTLDLREWNPNEKTYTGRELKRRVSYVLDSDQWTAPGCVIMALAPTPQGEPGEMEDYLRGDLIDRVVKSFAPQGDAEREDGMPEVDGWPELRRLIASGYSDDAAQLARRMAVDCARDNLAAEVERRRLARQPEPSE